MRRSFLVLGVMPLLSLAACPGDGVYSPRPPAPYLDGSSSWGGSWYDLFLGNSPDGPVAAPDAGAPPAAQPDAAPLPPPPPDLGVQSPPGEGLACSAQSPCSAGMVCFNGTCRATCVKSGACNAQGACPATHGCVTTNLGVAICAPALSQPGGTCSPSAYCPVGYVCGTTGAGYTCLPTCTASPCGAGGGQCIAVQAGCSICSTL